MTDFLIDLVSVVIGLMLVVCAVFLFITFGRLALAIMGAACALIAFGVYLDDILWG